MKTKGKLDSRNNSVHISQKGNSHSRNFSMTSSLTGFGAEKLLEAQKGSGAKHISPEQKFEQMRVQKENDRLYGNIINMEKSLQFAFLGLNKTKRRPQDRALEAGLVLRASIKKNVMERDSSSSPSNFKFKLQSMKSILEKDRMIRDLGGHQSKNLAIKNSLIDTENERFLAKLKQQKSRINFQQKEKDFKEATRIKNNLTVFPSIATGAKSTQIDSSARNTM